jgi:hypothetical protein
MIIISSFAFSQNAYKNFAWGMSIKQVKEICPDLTREEESDIWSMDFLAVGVHLNTIFNRTLIFPTDLIVEGNTYKSLSNNLSFYFDNDKLRIINILNFEGIVRDDLEKRYGKPIEFQNSLYTQRYMTEVYLNDQNRYIIAGVRYFGTYGTAVAIEKLLFTDRTWLTSAFNTFFENYKKEYNNKANSVLD